MRATIPSTLETLSPTLDRRRPVRLLELIGNTPP